VGVASTSESDWGAKYRSDLRFTVLFSQHVRSLLILFLRALYLGYTLIHALLESGFVDIVLQALLHERLLQSIGAEDSISIASALASAFYSLDSNGNSAGNSTSSVVFQDSDIHFMSANL
jgi:hypothetical protein